MEFHFLFAVHNWEQICPAVLVSKAMPKGGIWQHICSHHTFALKFMSTSIAQY